MDYMQVYAIGTVFVQLTLGLDQLISAQGFSKTSMFTVLIGAVCNIMLDPVFIFVFGMGVRGAALAARISQCISMIWTLRFLMSKRTTIRLKRENAGLSAKVNLHIITLGLAPFIMQSTESLLAVCLIRPCINTEGIWR